MAAIGRSRRSRHSSMGPAAVHRMGKSRQNGADTGMEGAVASSQHQETGELKAIPQEVSSATARHCRELCCNFGVYLNFKSKLSTHEENYSGPVSSFF